MWRVHQRSSFKRVRAWGITWSKRIKWDKRKRSQCSLTSHTSSIFISMKQPRASCSWMLSSKSTTASRSSSAKLWPSLWATLACLTKSRDTTNSATTTCLKWTRSGISRWWVWVVLCLLPEQSPGLQRSSQSCFKAHSSALNVVRWLPMSSSSSSTPNQSDARTRSAWTGPSGN